MLARLALGLLLAAGLAGAAQAQGQRQSVIDFDGQYSGEMTLLRTVSGDCTEPPLGALYPLVVREGIVQFKYVPRFDTRLSGRIDAAGNFKATARVKSGLVQMTGRIVNSRAFADIVSPSCHYRFESRR